MTLDVGRLRLELIHVDIHSDDAAVLWLAADRLLLAGDTLEDTVTYLAEPDGLDRHLADLERLWDLDPGASCPTTALPTSSPPAATPRASSARLRTTSASCSAAVTTLRCATPRWRSSSPTPWTPAGSRTSRPMRRCTARTSRP